VGDALLLWIEDLDLVLRLRVDGGLIELTLEGVRNTHSTVLRTPRNLFQVLYFKGGLESLVLRRRRQIKEEGAAIAEQCP